MTGSFSFIDWLIVAGYLSFLIGMGWKYASHKSANVNEYFLGGNQMPYLVVAVSVIATTQSAATFLGGPDQGYRGDYTYLAANTSAIIASVFIAKILIPRYYAIKATTVYELLDNRYGPVAMRAAGLMYLVGRLFASGARLYLAAIAVAMILFGDIAITSIIGASLILLMLGFTITFLGGIRSVIWTDLFQFTMYTFSAIAIVYLLLDAIPLSIGEITASLRETPEGINKLQLFNFGFDFTDPYAMISVFSGLILLYIGSFGLDQDITQRVLTCKNENQGARALIISVLIGIPLIWLFMTIGELLYIFYDRPDLMETAALSVTDKAFQGEDITVFMFYILNELPPGLRGLVTAGVIAAAVSTINSGLNSMSSVLIQDFYRPWIERATTKSERHYVIAGQYGMALVGLGLFSMSVLCYYWQRYSGLPLLDFALSVMVFAYSGLLGVYFTALFTNRGSSGSVIAALIAGFLVTLLGQGYIIELLSMPDGLKGYAFTWQLSIGTLISFTICMMGKKNA